MQRREATLARIKERISSLCSSFDSYLDYFDKENLFSGPSLYFHLRTIEKLKNHKSLVEAIDDDIFLECLYATLTSWGLHRMGPGGAKLVDFNIFIKSLRNQKNAIANLEGEKLTEINEHELNRKINDIWNILDHIKVSASQTKLVANSKALHHLLPNLVTPIDREYTLTFFFGHKAIRGKDEQIFREVFPWFYKIGRNCKSQIMSRVGQGFHTSETKVIDNAIVGFVLKNIKNTR